MTDHEFLPLADIEAIDSASGRSEVRSLCRFDEPHASAKGEGACRRGAELLDAQCGHQGTSGAAAVEG